MPSFPLAPLPPTPPAAIAGAPSPGRFVTTNQRFLGFGITRPFRRDKKSDFAAVGGAPLVQSCVGQILGTQCSTDQSQGELPWRTEFGSRLYQLRHRNNDAVLAELARVYVVEALQRWEPRVRVKNVSLTRESSGQGGDNTLAIRLHYDIINANTEGNQVVLRDVTQDVVL